MKHLNNIYIKHRFAIKRYIFLLFPVLFLIIITACEQERESLSVTSPDGINTIHISNNSGVIHYSFSTGGDTIVANSVLGFGQADSFQILNIERASLDEIWKPVWGQFSSIRNNYKQVKLFMEGNSGIQMNIIVRTFNDGVGFRYEFPEQDLDSIELNDLTSFTFLKDHKLWYGEQHFNWDEPDQITLSEKNNYRPAVILQINNSLFVALREADLNNCSPLFFSNEGNNTLTCITSGEKVSLPYESPWRSITVARKPGGLIESSLVLNLNDEPEGDFSWVKPGKSFWDWRVRGAKFADYEYCSHDVTTECCKHFIKKASKLGIEYFMIDAGWYGPEHSPDSDPTVSLPSIDIPYLVSYGKELGVGLWLYINDIAFRNYDHDTILSTYSDWGVVGIKHGFIRGKGKEKVNHSFKVLGKCAEYRIMCDQHEAFNSAGIQRKYPNYLGVENGHTQLDGCSGGRQDKFMPPEILEEKQYVSDASNKPCADVIVPPSYHTINPFTTALAGPKDFTPGVFDCNDGHKQGRLKYNAPLPSTINNQMALCNINNAGILCLMDAPESYEQYPDMFEFIQYLPQSFDETRVIDSEIGEYLIIARRRDDNWFISGITNQKAREMKLPFDFLPEGEYNGKYYSDDKSNTYLGEKEKYLIQGLSHIKPSGQLTINMVPGGGFNIHLSKL